MSRSSRWFYGIRNRRSVGLPLVFILERRESRLKFRLLFTLNGKFTGPRTEVEE